MERKINRKNNLKFYLENPRDVIFLILENDDEKFSFDKFKFPKLMRKINSILNFQ